MERCAAVERMDHSANELPWAGGKHDCNRKKGEKVKETERELDMLHGRRAE